MTPSERVLQAAIAVQIERTASQKYDRGEETLKSVVRLAGGQRAFEIASVAFGPSWPKMCWSKGEEASPVLNGMASASWYDDQHKVIRGYEHYSAF